METGLGQWKSCWRKLILPILLTWQCRWEVPENFMWSNWRRASGLYNIPTMSWILYVKQIIRNYWSNFIMITINSIFMRSHEQANNVWKIDMIWTTFTQPSRKFIWLNKMELTSYLCTGWKFSRSCQSFIHIGACSDWNKFSNILM